MTGHQVARDRCVTFPLPLLFVIPAEAGIPLLLFEPLARSGIPAFAGMTGWDDLIHPLRVPLASPTRLAHQHQLLGHGRVERNDPV